MWILLKTEPKTQNPKLKHKTPDAGGPRDAVCTFNEKITDTKSVVAPGQGEDFRLGIIFLRDLEACDPIKNGTFT